MATSLAITGVAIGTALPQSTTASLVLLAAAACCLVIVTVRDPSLAPLHGLHRVVRLPLRRSVAVAVESLTSRLVGTLRAAFSRRPKPTPILLDEPDEEADEWWGATAAPTPPAPGPAPPLPAPVLAASMASAHVQSPRTRSIRARIAQLGMHLRRWTESRTKQHRPSNDGASAST